MVCAENPPTNGSLGDKGVVWSLDALSVIWRYFGELGESVGLRDIFRSRWDWKGERQQRVQWLL